MVNVRKTLHYKRNNTMNLPVVHLCERKLLMMNYCTMNLPTINLPYNEFTMQ